MFRRNQTRIEIEQKIARGIPKAGIFQELHNDHNDRLKLIKMLNSIPTPQSRERFRNVNFLLFTMMVVVLMMDVIFINLYSLPIILLDLYLLSIIRTFRYRKFLLFSVRWFISLIPFLISPKVIQLGISIEFFYFSAFFNCFSFLIGTYMYYAVDRDEFLGEEI
jgi:hypothetical protein